MNPAGQPTNATEYEQHFNATDIASGWAATPFTGIPLIGDIFAGFNFLWQNMKYLVDGFPMLLDYIKNTYITDLSGRAAFDVIAWTLRAIYGLLITSFLIEFISGRIFTD